MMCGASFCLGHEYACQTGVMFSDSVSYGQLWLMLLLSLTNNSLGSQEY